MARIQQPCVKCGRSFENTSGQAKARRRCAACRLTQRPKVDQLCKACGALFKNRVSCATIVNCERCRAEHRATRAAGGRVPAAARGPKVVAQCRGCLARFEVAPSKIAWFSTCAYHLRKRLSEILSYPESVELPICQVCGVLIPESGFQNTCSLKCAHAFVSGERWRETSVGFGLTECD